jgi:Carboxypeptidase regulatory-like domain
MWTRNVALVMIGVLSGMVAWLVTTWYLHRTPPQVTLPVEDTADLRGSITGIVAATGDAPVANARVCANALSPRVLAIEPLPRCTQTDAAGRYTIGALLAGAYQIVALAPTSASATRNLTVMPDEQRREIDLMVPAGSGLATASR